MRMLIFLAIVAYIFWILKGRGWYILFKYGKETGIDFKSDYGKEELFAKLKSELTYPKLQEIFYDEEGRISVRGKHSSYSLKIENERLYVCKSNLSSPNEIEEAECLKAYIEKIFNPNSNSNPRAMYESMEGFRKKSIIIGIILTIAFILFCVFAINDSGATDAIASKNISASYFTEYSSSKTIGEAFDDFFASPKWTSYKQGAHEYVDFSGGCTYGDKTNAKMVITFALFNDSFQIERITIDGEEIPPIMHSDILYVIYDVE